MSALATHGQGLKQVARQDTNRLGFLAGVATTVATQALVVLWADQFNAESGSAALGPGLIPSALVGTAAGLVVRRITLRVVPGTHGTNTTWLALLGWPAPSPWSRIAISAPTGDRWLPLVPYLPLLLPSGSAAVRW